MLITRLRPFVTTVSELIKSKENSEEVIVGGEIKRILHPIEGVDTSSNSSLLAVSSFFLDDSVGEVLVLLPNPVYDKQKSKLFEGNLVLVKGFVHHLCTTHKGIEIGREVRVVASSLVELETAEERSREIEQKQSDRVPAKGGARGSDDELESSTESGCSINSKSNH